MTFENELKHTIGLVNLHLEGYFNEMCPQKTLLEAMRYSLLAGGKRIRPVLVLKFCEAAGGDAKKAMPIAAAVEMVHTYSLIHDDLPIMDNDDLRRGKPTCHKVYGECTAALAGDALQASAFYTLMTSELASEVKAEAAKTLALAAGEMGMCGGQELDIRKTVTKTPEELDVINDLKTGAILMAACEMGVIAAGETDVKKRAAAKKYGECLAKAFQIKDDILDIISTDERLGKPVGSDASNGKETYASLLGVEECEKLVEKYTQMAKEALLGAFEDVDFLLELADTLKVRTY